METPRINWYHEAIRIVPLLIMFCIFLATVDKNIALNQKAIEDNQKAIEKIMDNHLPHIQAKLDIVSETTTRIEALLIK